MIAYVGTYASVEERGGPTYPDSIPSCYEELREWWRTLSGQAGCYRKVQPADIPPAWRTFFLRNSEAFRKVDAARSAPISPS